MGKIETAFDAEPAIKAELPLLNDLASDSVKGSDSADTSRRKSRLSVAVRRVRFLARFIYWTCKHGSPKHAAWVCNYEGLYW